MLSVGLLAVGLLGRVLLGVLAAVGGTLLLLWRWRRALSLTRILGLILRRILAGLLAGILHGVLIGLIASLVALGLLGDLAVLSVWRRSGLAPLTAGAGLRLILRLVGGLLLVRVSGLRLLDGVLRGVRLVAIRWVLRGRPGRRR